MPPIWGMHANQESVYVGPNSTSHTSRNQKVIFHIVGNLVDLPYGRGKASAMMSQP